MPRTPSNSPSVPQLPPDEPGIHWASDENNEVRQQAFVRKIKIAGVALLAVAVIALVAIRPWETSPSASNSGGASVVSVTNSPDGSYMLQVRLPADQYGNPVSEVVYGGCRPAAPCDDPNDSR